MRATICLLGAVLAVAGVYQAYAQEPGKSAEAASGILKPVVTSTPHSALFGLTLDQGRGVAVGAKGSIYESQDGGQNWAAVAQTPTHSALLSVSTRGGKAVAVGLSGLVLTSSEKGKWEKAESGTPNRLLSVDMNSSGLAVAAGEFGTVIHSTDAGKTWAAGGPDWSTFVTPDNLGAGEPMLYAAVVSEEGHITLAGEFGLIVRSKDGGATWQVLRAPVSGAATINGLYMQPAGSNSYAVGQRGELLISADGGDTWGRCTVATKLNFLGVSGSPNGQVVISGMRVMYRSVNGGMTWDLVRDGDAASEWYQAVRTDPSGRIYAVGHSGRIIQIGS